MSKFKDFFSSNSKQITAQLANTLSGAIAWQRNRTNALLGKYFGGNRDIYQAIGYIRTITNENYYNYYSRNPVARAVIKAYPNACWRIPPEITENEDQSDTAFERDIKRIIEELQLFKYLKRADRLAGLYHYSVILLGIADGKKLEDPAGTGALSYIQVYDEDNAKIWKYDTDSKSPRFGKPEIYQITTCSTNGSTSEKVHWSRIIHIAEDPDCGDIFGTPKLKAIYNNIQNIEMISAANAEGYWRGGFAGIVAEFDKDADISEPDKTTYKEEMQKYIDGYQRSLRIKGGQLRSINVDVKDPNPHIMTQIKLISTETEIPQRILTGSEQGKLAADQDSTAWLDNVAGRQLSFCTPDIVRAVVDRLIVFKSVATPENNEYFVIWQDLKDTDDKTIAETSKLKTEALTIYAGEPQAQILFPPEQFYKMFLGLSQEEIDTIDIGEVAPADITEDDLFPDDTDASV